MKANQHGMTAEALAFGATELMPLAVPDGMNVDQLGVMTSQRWDELIEQIGTIAPDEASSVKSSDCFTLQFL